MRRRSLGVEKSPEIMIIPMIDIVFFLLVFFMISTLYVTREEQIPLSLPQSTSSSVKTLEPVTISLTSDKKLYVNQNEISKEQLGKTISGLLQSEPNQAFVVRASKDVIYQDVVMILDELKKQGATHVSIATERK